MKKSIIITPLVIIMVVLSYFLWDLYGPAEHDDDKDYGEPLDNKPKDDYYGSHSARIHLDGEFSDWDDIPVIYDDTGDSGRYEFDFGILKIANDERYIFFYLEINSEVLLQGFNNSTINSTGPTLYLDTDNSSITGFEKNGIGAELAWDFDQRVGTFYYDKTSTEIHHDDLGLLTAPTVTSDRFEIAVDLNSIIKEQLLFTGNDIKVIFHLNTVDILPDKNGHVIYTIDTSTLPPVMEITTEKVETSDFRTMSYNVMRDNLFDPERFDEYDRILSALNPDIIGFQEIYTHTANETSVLMEKMLPSENGTKWYSAKVNPDIVLVSRFHVNKTYSVNSTGAFLLDIDSDSQLLVIVAHLPSGGNRVERYFEIYYLMKFVEGAMESGGKLELKKNTPIIIMGDMNLVGNSNELRMFMREWYDWDENGFADLMPRHTGSTLYFTWYSESSSYWPGRLDFMFYTDSVLTVDKKFVLFNDDAKAASDHLPVVADFKILQ